MATEKSNEVHFVRWIKAHGMNKEFSEIVELTSDIDDFSSLLKAARKASKIEYDPDVRIAIIGSCSIQLIVGVIRALLLANGIAADIYEGQYNGLRMDVIDDKSPLYEFSPDFVVVIPDYRDVDHYPMLFSSRHDVDKCILEGTEYLMTMCEKIHMNLPKAQILLSNIVIPYIRPLGNMEANCIFSREYYYRNLDIRLSENSKDYLTIIDVESLAEYVGKRNWFDESAYYLNKSGFSVKYIGRFCNIICNQIIAVKGKIRKCIVLDLDNTLWGGIVGDVGYDGINLDPNDAVGEAYLGFQSYLLTLKERGIILAVCSKNDPQIAREPFDKNEYMVLKYDDISCFVANWNDKAGNIRTIASELNIGLDSLVFFDDNPAEREIVRSFIPEVAVVDVPEDPALYVRALEEADLFEWNALTKEDVSRSDSYVDNRKRQEMMLTVSDYDEYLKSLDMTAAFKTVSEKTLTRFSQLINKSNQFNLRTRRYSESEIHEMMTDPSIGLYTISLKDCFSDYGIISCLLIRYMKDRAFIDSWVMSCRVLKRGVEVFVFSKIKELLMAKGIKQIEGEYIPTRKNALVADLLPSLRFIEKGRSADGIVHYVLDINGTNEVEDVTYIKEDSQDVNN